jgi:hypothetical protein
MKRSVWMNPSPGELKASKRAKDKPDAFVSATPAWMTPSPGTMRVESGQLQLRKPAWMTPSPGTMRVESGLASSASRRHREVHLDMATIMMAAATDTVGFDEQSVFARNGANTERVAAVVGKKCKCSYRCREKLNANLNEVQQFCARFHALTPEEQLHLFEVCYWAVVFDSGGWLYKGASEGRPLVP